MGKKLQFLGNQAVGIQAERDIIVKNGIDADELTRILDSHNHCVVALAAETARQKAQERVEELTPKIIERITSQPHSSPEALKDPDFHYALFKAQQAYARSGEPNVGELLVDLIGRRAAEGGRTRLALTLNDAIEKVAVLTANEFATLSVVYILRCTINNGVNNYEKFIDWLRGVVLPHIVDLPDHDLSLSYLEAQSCGKISMGTIPFRELFVKNYSGVLSKGFDREELCQRTPEQYRNALYDPEITCACLHDSGKCQLNALNKDVFSKVAGKHDLPVDVVNNIWAYFEGTLWSDKEFADNICQLLPEFARLEKLWRETRLSNFELNTAGIAIGHGNIRRVSGIDADLSIWIK